MQNISQMVCVFVCNLHLKRCGLRIAVGSGTEQSYEETIWQKTQESPVSIPLRCSPPPPEHGSTSVLSLSPSHSLAQTLY